MCREGASSCPRWKWIVIHPLVCLWQARLLNPPTPDHKETIYYMHPTLGRQRWLFARSWVTPASSTTTMAAPVPSNARMGFTSRGGMGESFGSSGGRFSTGGLYPSGGSFSTMPSPLPDAFTSPALFEDESPTMQYGGGYGRQSMYSRLTPSDAWGSH
jgi:hypothetical protein